MDFFNKIGEKLSTGVSATTTKTKEFAEIQRLNGMLNQQKAAINTKYTAIGMRYFNEYGDSGMDDELTQMCMDIKLIQSDIDKTEDSIIELKREKKCEKCGKVIPMESTFCAFCGTGQSALKKCVKCIAPLENGAVFCTNCGTKQPIVTADSPNVKTLEPSGNAVLGEVEREDAVEAIPAQAPVAVAIPTQAPVAGAIPAQAPVAEAIPAQAPVAAAIPAQAPVAGAIPAQAPVAGAIPAQAPVVEEISTQIPVPTSTSANTDKIFCTECGNPEDTGSLFCTECGSKF